VSYHPGFDFVTMNDDIGFAVLSSPAEVPPVPTLQGESGALVAGAVLRVVGFGLDGSSDASPSIKRSGSSVVLGSASDRITLAPDPSQPCRGDSGGPSFLTIDGRDVLVGVTSEGDSQCDTFAVDTRVDAYALFIDDEIASVAVPSAEASGGCSIGNRSPNGSAGAMLDLFAASVFAIGIRSPIARKRTRASRPRSAS
jgi:hypothetical protein